MNSASAIHLPPAPPVRPKDLGFFGRLKAFADAVFEPKLHATFAGLWSLSLLAALRVVSAGASGAAFRWDLAALVPPVTIFVCTFFLRMVDEIKDYDYDVVHNPKRPLVTGVATRAHVAVYLAVFAAIVLTLNAAVAPVLAVAVALDLLYGLGQLPLERASKLVKDNLLVNLAVVYPVNVGLSAYTLLFFLERSGGAFEARHALLVAAFAFAFLHFEIARKSGWPHLAAAGERLYSEIVGVGGALALSTAFAVAALGIVVGLFAPWARDGAAAFTGWLPLLAVVPAVVGAIEFARSRDRRHAARPPAVAFLFVFYVAVLVHALVAGA